MYGRDGSPLEGWKLVPKLRKLFMQGSRKKIYCIFFFFKNSIFSPQNFFSCYDYLDPDSDPKAINLGFGSFTVKIYEIV
jgi:hypothetical protein